MSRLPLRKRYEVSPPSHVGPQLLNAEEITLISTEKNNEEPTITLNKVWTAIYLLNFDQNKELKFVAVVILVLLTFIGAIYFGTFLY